MKPEPTIEAEMLALAEALERHARLLRHFTGPPPEGSRLAEGGIYRTCGLAATRAQLKETSARLARLDRRVDRIEFAKFRESSSEGP